MFGRRRPPRRNALGCCLGLWGVLLGGAIGQRQVSRAIAEDRAADPDATVCGNAVLGGMFAPAFLVGTLGAAAGIIWGRVFPGRRTNPCEPKPTVSASRRPPETPPSGL